MKTKTLFGSSFAALVLFAAATQAFGQEPAPVAITVFAGGSFLKGERIFNVGGTPMRTNYANGGRLGFRGTISLDSRWALEGTYSYGGDNLRITDLSGAVPSTRYFGVKGHQFTGNALYYVNPAAAKFRVFGTAGIGLARFSPTDAAKASAKAFIRPIPTKYLRKIISPRLEFEIAMVQTFQARYLFACLFESPDGHIFGPGFW